MAKKNEPIERVSYSLSEFCARHGFSKTTCYRWIDKGLINVTRSPSGRIRVPVSEDQKLAGGEL